jgi:hypothetical protein
MWSLTRFVGWPSPTCCCVCSPEGDADALNTSLIMKASKSGIGVAGGVRRGSASPPSSSARRCRYC